MEKTSPYISVCMQAPEEGLYCKPKYRAKYFQYVLAVLSTLFILDRFSRQDQFAVYISEKRRALETKDFQDYGKDYGTSGLHVCSRDVSIYCMGESWRFLLPIKISLFQTANQKNSKKFKNPMSPEPFVSRAKAPPAKGRTIRKLMWEWGGGGIFGLQEFLFGPVPVQEFFFDCSPMYDFFLFYNKICFMQNFRNSPTLIY